jgi:hypothetical protein
MASASAHGQEHGGDAAEQHEGLHALQTRSERSPPLVIWLFGLLSHRDTCRDASDLRRQPQEKERGRATAAVSVTSLLGKLRKGCVEEFMAYHLGQPLLRQVPPHADGRVRARRMVTIAQPRRVASRGPAPDGFAIAGR